MNRRGLTLIELLLVIGLMLTVGALVLPAIFTGLRERSFESAAEVVRSQLLLARAHAQVTRRPVEVMYESTPPRRPGVRARYFLVETPGPAMNRSTSDDLLRTDPDQVIVEGWADRDLPDGLRLTDQSETDPLPDIARLTPGTPPVVFRLAVYMPDGSAPIVRPVWISDEHGRRGKLDVNSWTGLPSFERVFGDDGLMPEPVDDVQPAREPPADSGANDDAPAEEDSENEP